MKEYNISTLVDGCNKLDIALSDIQIQQFIRFYELLIEKNRVMNLTSVTEWDDVVTRHYLDSLLAVRIFHKINLHADSISILDLGTGAGFPGIPLKIAFPGINIVLADSLQKRINFLDNVIEELHLETVSTVHARAEELGRSPGYREQYDLVISRAVSNLQVLSEYCLPLVKKGGHFISYKSTDIDTEFKTALRAISLLGGAAGKPDTFRLPETDIVRSFVTVEKVGNTPDKYPRRSGIPSKNPL